MLDRLVHSASYWRNILPCIELAGKFHYNNTKENKNLLTFFAFSFVLNRFKAYSILLMDQVFFSFLLFLFNFSLKANNLIWYVQRSIHFWIDLTHSLYINRNIIIENENCSIKTAKCHDVYENYYTNKKIVFQNEMSGYHHKQTTKEKMSIFWEFCFFFVLFIIQPHILVIRDLLRCVTQWLPIIILSFLLRVAVFSFLDFFAFFSASLRDARCEKI